MPRASKIRASKQPYLSTKQLTIDGFESPFSNHLNSDNRWVRLAQKIPWDSVVSVYDKQMRNDVTGASHINGRVVLGSLMIKHMCNLSDEETMMQIQENIYMQYFIGYKSFSSESPFDPSLFVEIRKRLGVDQINAINEKIVALSVFSQMESTAKKEGDEQTEDHWPNEKDGNDTLSEATDDEVVPSNHHGRLLLDATACPQDIAYPTDLNILNDAREKSEDLIDFLYRAELHKEKKPRTYRKKARKSYLQTAQKKIKSKNEIRTSVGKQLRYLKRNIKHIHKLLDAYDDFPLDQNQQKYLFVIQEAYRQQKLMWNERTHNVEHRIVSIHQPHVRPIVRGKQKAKVEFGSKIQLSLVNGYAFLDEFSWDAFNEGTLLIESVEHYKRRFGFYPQEVLADKIYCNRENRRRLKELHIKLVAKPLGRPSAVNKEHVRPGERNPIEGKFGQAKTSYGMDRIKARLNNTSQSWVASIILVLNLVKLAGQVPLHQILEIWRNALIIIRSCRQWWICQKGLLFQ
jgi:transposase, IS5 family